MLAFTQLSELPLLRIKAQFYHLLVSRPDHLRMARFTRTTNITGNTAYSCFPHLLPQLPYLFRQNA
jgi:hypothetical protein